MKVVLAGLAVLALAGCGSGGTANTAAPTSTSAAATAPVATPSPASPTAHPLAFYAAQFLRLTAASHTAQDKLRDLLGASTLQQTQAATTALVQVEQITNAQLLRAEWPPSVGADIRALVLAEGPLLGDLSNIATGSGSVGKDSGAVTAASNIVRADLGLPPIL